MLPFIITIVAGLSTLLGFLFVYLPKTSNKILISSLAFASGVMFLISIYDLLPASFILISNTYHIIFTFLICSIFIVTGIIISITIDKYLPDSSYNNSSLYRVGIISMIAIIIHNIPEGIATFLTSLDNIKLGITLAIALALHNIPEGICVAVPIYYSTKSKKISFLYTLLSGMSEFIGALIAYIFLTRFINDLFMGCLYSIIAGIMLHISIYELLPISLKYKNYLRTTIYFIIGLIFMFISCNLLK